jgi:hypothetical protein
MPVPCFTRQERNGIHFVLPLAGPQKFNTVLLNQTSFDVLEQLRAGWGFDEVVADYCARAQGDGSPTRARLRFDLYRLLLQLRDHGICDYPMETLTALLPPGRRHRDETQVMPVEAAAETAELFRDALSREKGARFFFSTVPCDAIGSEYFDPGHLVRRHLTGREACFVHLDHWRAVTAATALVGYGGGLGSMNVQFVAARGASEQRFEAVVREHLVRLRALLATATISPILRFQAPEPSDLLAVLHESFAAVLGAVGFRKSFSLPDELAPGRGLTAWDLLLARPAV